MRSILDPLDPDCGTTIHVPYFFYLIQHPDGACPFDNGAHPALIDDPRLRLGDAADLYDIVMCPGDDVVSRLNTLGVDAEGIGHVVQSHLHYDHAGGLEFLSEATVYVQKQELPFAYWPPVYQREIYIREDFDSVKNWKALNGDHDIFNDGRLLIFPTPGHTAGHQSLLVRLDNQAFILVGDAAYDREKMQHRCLPGVLWSPDAIVESWERIEETAAPAQRGAPPHPRPPLGGDGQARPGRMVRVSLAEAAVDCPTRPPDHLSNYPPPAGRARQARADLRRRRRRQPRAGSGHEVQSFAGYLRPRIAPGDRVAILLATGPSSWSRGWRSSRAVRCWSSMNPTASSHDAGHVLRRFRSKLAGRGRRERRPVPRASGVVPRARGDPGGRRRGARRPRPVQRPPAAGPTRPPGTTSPTCTTPPARPARPKAAWSTIATGCSFAELMPAALRLHRERPLDCAACSSSTTIRRGSCCWPWPPAPSLVVMRRFSVSRYWDVVRDHDVTVLFGIASTASLLLKGTVERPGARSRRRLSIQVGIPAPLHAGAGQQMGRAVGRGLRPDRDRARRSRCRWTRRGHDRLRVHRLPCPGVDVRGSSTTGDKTSAGRAGRDRRPRPGLMRGYLNRPDATAETFRGGWLHTGDLGRRDAAGFVYFSRPHEGRHPAGPGEHRRG